MAFSEGLANIAANYRFHASLRGGLLRRWGYLTAYYLIYVLFRSGDRHLRALIWLKRLGLSDLPVEVETPDGIQLRLDLHTSFDVLFSILHDRDYERVEGFAPAPGQVVIDAGANIGVFTTRAAKAVGASGRVVAIEPHPGNFSLLSGNVERNAFKNVALVQAAVDDHEGEAKLYLHDRAINHSLVRPSERSIPMRLRTLDSLARELGLGKVDLLKIDTEGNVPGILRGARGLLKDHRPRIVFERDTREESRGLAELFSELGYGSRDVRCFTYAWPSGG